MGMIPQDLRLGLRAFKRRPGFSFVATGTLALGIGAHAALFSVVDDVLLEPVDLPRSDELVVVRMRVQGELRDLTGPNVADLLRASGDVFQGASGFLGTGAILENPDGTREQRSGVIATPGVFDALGAGFQVGQPWGAEAAGTGGWSDVVITDRLWRGRFGADPDLVGSTVVMDGGSARVTGVLAPGFVFPTFEAADLVFPPQMDLAGIQRSGLGAFTILARLRPGISPERARSEVEGIWEGIRAAHPGDLLDHRVAVMGLRDYVVREVRPALLALLGATTLLLILACANVANLMLARGIGRGAEMSIRSSLGAGRGRLARQLLWESTVLAGFAGILGVVLAGGLLAALRSAAPAEIPGVAEVGLSSRAIGSALSLALGSALLVGLFPSLRLSGADLSSALRSGARATAGLGLRRLQDGLVVAQVAAAVVLVIGAGLLARSFASLAAVDPGYRTAGVLTVGMSLPGDRYPDRSSRAAFFRRVEREVAAIPGVRSVGTTYRAPFSTGELSLPVRLADAEEMTLERAPRVEIGIVSAGYLDALEIPVLRGRGFTDEDTGESSRVALLSESLARTLYGDDDPVGRRLAPVLGSWESARDWAEVVGVVGDIRLEGLDAEAAGTLYVVAPQLAQTWGTLLIQASGDPTELARPVREVLLELEPKVVIPSIESMASLRADSLARPRFNLVLLSVFSGVALLLAVVGIYGTLSYSIARRRLELGVRVAFGADRASVLRLVVTDGMRLAGLGILIGVGGALLVGRGLASLLFEVAPTDGATYVGTVVGMAVIALAGSLVPALRAAGGDALEALGGD